MRVNLLERIKQIDLRITARGEIMSIMRKVDYDINKLNVKQKNDINNLIAILDSSKKLA